jgi:YD repeat-containing protein
VTEYSYDDLKRPFATTILRGSSSVTTTQTLDGAGRVLQAVSAGASASITNSRTAYDYLGRPVRQTNALGGVTATSYAMINSGSQLVTTTVNPDGGTSITTNYSDGRVQGVGGTAVSPVTYQYGVDNSVGGSYHEYTLTTKLSAGQAGVSP